MLQLKSNAHLNTSDLLHITGTTGAEDERQGLTQGQGTELGSQLIQFRPFPARLPEEAPTEVRLNGILLSANWLQCRFHSKLASPASPMIREYSSFSFETLRDFVT